MQPCDKRVAQTRECPLTHSPHSGKQITPTRRAAEINLFSSPTFRALQLEMLLEADTIPILFAPQGGSALGVLEPRQKKNYSFVRVYMCDKKVDAKSNRDGKLCVNMSIKTVNKNGVKAFQSLNNHNVCLLLPKYFLVIDVIVILSFP